MKNVRGSQPCISMNFCMNSLKDKFFPACIVKAYSKSFENKMINTTSLFVSKLMIVCLFIFTQNFYSNIMEFDYISKYFITSDRTLNRRKQQLHWLKGDRKPIKGKGLPHSFPEILHMVLRIHPARLFWGRGSCKK